MSIFTPNRNYLRGEWLTAHHMLGERADMDEFEYVFNQYREPWRRYHGVSHLKYGLRNIVLILHSDPVKLPMREIGLVLLAYFYHDVIMGGKDNEFASAERAAHYLSRFLSPVEVERVKALILATADHQGSKLQDPLWPILNDADLAILMSSPRTYRKYANNIWLEYKPVVSRADFITGRTRFLKNFTTKPVFKTVVMKPFDKCAIDNMFAEMIDLNQS